MRAPAMLAVREIQKLPTGSRAYLVSEAVRAEHESFRFLAPHVTVRDLSAEQIRQSPPRLDAPLVIFVFDDAPTDLRGVLEKAYPGCRIEGFIDGWNLPVFTVFRAHPPGLEVHPQEAVPPSRRLSDQPGAGLVALATLGVILLFVQRFCAARAANAP
jgi:hypothetical protein